MCSEVAALLVASSAVPAISVRGLAKSFDVFPKPIHRLTDLLLNRPASSARQQYPVFEDVNFEVWPGEAFGIIGRNGSGKSTLLQCICGTLDPTAGSVEINGRLAALLELGAGFNPEFTGRDNIGISASLIGMRPEEVASRMEEILAFADIGDYIDQPVKTYSSGMFVRLAFAIVAHSNASVLVVDEALAVGDVFFTQKCMRFIRSFLDSGGALLFVSHDMASVVNLCRRGIMLFPHGSHRPVIADADKLCKDYLARTYDDPERLAGVAAQRSNALLEMEAGARDYPIKYAGRQSEQNLLLSSSFKSDADQFGAGSATINDVRFETASGELLRQFRGMDEVTLVIEADVLQEIMYPAFGFMIKDRHGQYVLTEGTDGMFRRDLRHFRAGERVQARFTFSAPILLPGEYSLNVALAEGLGDEHIQQHWIHDAMVIESIGGPVVHGLSGPMNLTCSIVRDKPE